MTWTYEARGDLKFIAECIEEVFPDAPYYGNEASGNIMNGLFVSGVVITCYVFDEPDTKACLLWVEEGTEIASLEDLWKLCSQEEGLRAVELIPSIAYLDALKMDGSVPCISDDILIFGGASVNYDDASFEADIIAKGHEMTRNGMAVMLYYGENFNASATYILGWKGLGRHMKVTKSQGKTISEIDGVPALSIYEKYLNLQDDDNDNLVFPLIVEEDGVEYIRTPQAFLPDKSMRMFANIAEGSMTRIAYGDKNTILSSLYEKTSEIYAIEPQAIKAYSCAARRLFWGDGDVCKETLPLQEIAPVCGFYTGGEILRFGRKLRVLNSTLVIVSLREGPVTNQKGCFKPMTVDKSLISRLTYFTERIVEEQEEQKVQLANQHKMLQEALAMADSANRAKTEFLFNMSHDIRTPMNAITGFTQMAIKHIDDKAKVLDCLEKTQRSGDLLLSLINSILDVSRIESGKAVLEEQNGDVYYSFVNVDSTMTEMAAAKDIDLSFEFGTIVDRYVLCDFSRCTRVFVNIISNAIKYTREGGWVKVRCEQIGNSCNGCGTYRYTFEDNGIGMSEEFQQHVFEQFAREKSVTLSGIQGTGLGMAVCKSFVDLMGGTIECRSKLGVGTTFIVTLPFKIQDGAKYTDPKTKEVVSAWSVVSPAETFDLSGKKVLLVEDNEMNREIATDILSDEGLEVYEAVNGQEAVSIMECKGPEFFDFILMDIQMPVMNGYEATKAIRRMYPDANIPIIAVSANAFAEDKAESMAAGMNDHVAKPINVSELLGVLDKCVTASRHCNAHRPGWHRGYRLICHGKGV